MATITTVTEYLELIKGIEIKHNVFFRGHSDDSYDLNPGIYRKIKDDKNLAEYEDEIYREVISKSPNEFVGKNTLESLALLQHYDAPTRVLDLTENALVALFFAVNKHYNEDRKDGEVIVFDIPSESVCHYNSDRVTALANIAKCDKDLHYSSDLVPIYRAKISELIAKKKTVSGLGVIYRGEIYDFFHKNENVEKVFAIDDGFELTNYDKNLVFFRTEYESINGKLEDKDLESFENKFIDSLVEMLNQGVNYSINNCNQKYFGKLIHNIREDKAYFDAIIDPAHISQVFAVRPKFDNPRIIRQQGAFLIFGVKEEIIPGWNGYKPMAELKTDWISRGLTKEKIIIDKDSKNKILRELEQLGINQSVLFPEVDKVADFVKRKFSEKL